MGTQQTKTKITLEELDSESGKVLPTREELAIVDYGFTNPYQYGGTTSPYSPHTPMPNNAPSSYWDMNRDFGMSGPSWGANSWQTNNWGGDSDMYHRQGSMATPVYNSYSWNAYDVNMHHKQPVIYRDDWTFPGWDRDINHNDGRHDGQWVDTKHGQDHPGHHNGHTRWEPDPKWHHDDNKWGHDWNKWDDATVFNEPRTWNDPQTYNDPTVWNAPTTWNSPATFNDPAKFNAPATWNSPVTFNEPTVWNAPTTWNAQPTWNAPVVWNAPATWNVEDPNTNWGSDGHTGYPYGHHYGGHSNTVYRA